MLRLDLRLRWVIFGEVVSCTQGSSFRCDARGNEDDGGVCGPRLASGEEDLMGEDRLGVDGDGMYTETLRLQGASSFNFRDSCRVDSYLLRPLPFERMQTSVSMSNADR